MSTFVGAFGPPTDLKKLFHPEFFNGTARFTKCKQLFEYHIYSYLETSGGQSSNLYLNVVHFFNASVK